MISNPERGLVLTRLVPGREIPVPVKKKNNSLKKGLLLEKENLA